MAKLQDPTLTVRLIGQFDVPPGAVVHREAVLVDDVDHVLPCAIADVLHVATRKHGAVEVWYLARPGATDKTPVQITGTGHEVPTGALHLGSVIDPGTPPGSDVGPVPHGAFVWHLWALADGGTR